MPASILFLFISFMNSKFCILNCDRAEAENILYLFSEGPEFYCLGVSDDYDSSMNLVLKSLPDIIIIDIDRNADRKNHSPFNLVNELFQYLDYLPILIAISSSTERAYDVIKLGFSDYLLKPILEIDIRRSLSKLKRNLKINTPEKICLKSNSDYQFIDLNQILYLKADNNTTDFILKDGKKITAFKTLKLFENILPSYFKRIHNSYVVNIHYLIRINFSKSKLSLSGVSEKIPFSRSHKKELELLKESLLAINSFQV